MSDTGKVVFLYKENWWRKKGLSGTAFSEKGPIQQLWDNSTTDELIESTGTDLTKRLVRVHALAGFVFGERDLSYLANYQSFQQSPIVNQMVSIYGEEARAYTKVVFKSWINDDHTNIGSDDGIRRNLVVPFGTKMVREKHGERVIFAGTESVPNEHGHMEGAVVGGLRAAEEVIRMKIDGWALFR